MIRRALLAFLAVSGSAWAEEAVPSVPPAIGLPRAAGPITPDGELSDPGWQGAAVIDTFFETVFGDNRVPNVRTVAHVTYDDKYFYIGLECDDPEPQKIRAPYVDRDQVIGTDDNVAVFLDTRNDRRSAQEFRVNPRGIQGDAIFNDATSTEDFSPDFYYDTAARVTDKGWQAEIRVPLSSLRFPKSDPQTWGIIVWRNYPRDRRYAIYSSPQPRGSNCLVCRSRELTGISGLPSSSHLVVAPYASAQDVARAPGAGEPLDDSPLDSRFGIDVKWSPSASTALDATVNPDFSQVEADVAQIAVNNRFALFFPEKRPFFLEGVDLLETPIQAVYSRTITSPRWGGRVTGKIGAASYTALLAQDKGGGSVILPGSTFSDLGPQDFESVVGIGRLRWTLGRSFLGFLYTGREIEGGGHNRVVGPDFQWRPNRKETVTGQLLISDTQTPERPDLVPEWDGRKLTAHGLYLNWNHDTDNVDWSARYQDFGDDFRADDGFVPQVGYREGRASLGYKFFPKGFLSFLRPFLFGRYTEDREGRLVRQTFFPGVFGFGRRNFNGELDLNFEKQRTGDKVLSITNLTYFFQIDPHRRLPRIGVQGFLGQDIDFFNVRVGDGGNVTAFGTIRPTDHLTLDVNSALQWLNVDDAVTGQSGRLFTAQVQRLKAQYNFGPRLFVRLIGQYVTTRRDPTLYLSPVDARSSSFSGSALFSYRINWQTALFAGYGDDRERAVDGDLARTGRQVFVKLSYAFQR